MEIAISHKKVSLEFFLQVDSKKIESNELTPENLIPKKLSPTNWLRKKINTIL